MKVVMLIITFYMYSAYIERHFSYVYTYFIAPISMVLNNVILCMYVAVLEIMIRNWSAVF